MLARRWRGTRRPENRQRWGDAGGDEIAEKEKRSWRGKERGRKKKATRMEGSDH